MKQPEVGVDAVVVVEVEEDGVGEAYTVLHYDHNTCTVAVEAEHRNVNQLIQVLRKAQAVDEALVVAYGVSVAHGVDYGDHN